MLFESISSEVQHSRRSIFVTFTSLEEQDLLRDLTKEALRKVRTEEVLGGVQTRNLFIISHVLLSVDGI